MSKQCLDIEQMKHLQELGLDTSNAYMSWIVDESMKYKPFISLSFDSIEHVDQTTCAIYTFTLQDIIDLLPSNIDGCYIEIGKRSVSYSDYESARTVVLKRKRYLIDAAYEMLCWCIENGYVKTNKED